MKKLMVFMLGMVMTLSANAQIVKDLEYPPVHFGLRAAFTTNSTTISGNNYSYSHDALPFAAFGAALDIRLVPSVPIYLETGMYYMNKGWKESYSENISGYKIDEEFTNHTHSIIMPLLASYHLYLTDNMSIQPFIGPYFGYGFNQFDDEDMDDEGQFDSGLRIGCGWNFGRLYLNVGYDIGFATSIEIKGGGYKSEYDRKNNTFFATLGINFAGGY